MKHIFIVNTASNPKAYIDNLCKKINDICTDKKIDFLILPTEKRGDTERLAKMSAEKYGECRIYACGGDGTVCEVANGIYGFKDVEFAVLPIGTANDFVRTFGGKESFLDIEELIKSKAYPIDCLTVNDRVSVNIINFGFDSSVVKTAVNLRRKAFVPKKMAYPISVSYNLIKFPKSKLHIELDDGTVSDGEFLLSLFANAQYYGGGYKSASLAKVNDGLMDIITVKPVKRRKFLRHVGKFQKGKLLGTPVADEFLTLKKCKEAIISKDEEFDICYDGEFIRGKKMVIKCIENGLKMVIPDKVMKEKKIDGFIF